ncbi:MAG: redoxin domain-containing protein [Bacteroidota bacterium]
MRKTVYFCLNVIHMMLRTLIFVCFALSLAACDHQIDQEQVIELPVEHAAFEANPQAVPKQAVKTLAIGAEAPDFSLPGVDEQWYSLQSFGEAKVLAIVFTCNHCPTAQAYEDRLIQLHEDYVSRGVAIVAISPNSPLGLLYEELGYSDLGDSFEDMKARAEDKAFPFPYLYDGDNEKASLAYGPVATPHAFVFDKERKLRYVGRLDGSEKPGTAQAEDVRAAIDALLDGQVVETAETKTFGCSTKWAWKTDYKKKVEADWEQKEIKVHALTVPGLKTLLQNETEELLMVNVWASWCGPCVLELPDLAKVYRMYQGRDFRFVSISADKAKNMKAAQKCLEKAHLPAENYVFDGEDKYQLIETVDPNWTGALPYTILIEPGGKIVYAKQGMIDFFELKKAIVDHPLIGRYY